MNSIQKAKKGKIKGEPWATTHQRERAHLETRRGECKIAISASNLIKLSRIAEFKTNIWKAPENSHE